jgi:hypothetical protein
MAADARGVAATSLRQSEVHCLVWGGAACLGCVNLLLRFCADSMSCRADVAANKLTPQELAQQLRQAVMSRFEDIADPDVVFMQNALGPAPPQPAPDFDIPTIFIALEGVLVCKQWDVRRTSVVHGGALQLSWRGHCCGPAQHVS